MKAECVHCAGGVRQGACVCRVHVGGVCAGSKDRWMEQRSWKVGETRRSYQFAIGREPQWKEMSKKTQSCEIYLEEDGHKYGCG